jgi:eukaryotic-like serine/threonine-protein kinase
MSHGNDSSEGDSSALSVSAPMVQAQLSRILASEVFLRSPSLTRFLRFAVEKSIDGQALELKEYVLGVEVFERKQSSFDPRLDPIVRVQARKLRLRLKEFYETEGRNDPLVIDLPKGGYAPVFRSRNGNEVSALVGDEQHPEAPAAVPLTERKASRLRFLILAATAALAVAAAAFWRHKDKRDAPPQMPQMALRALTFDTGYTAEPTVSRDGKWLAYSSDRGEAGDADIWVQPLGGGEPRQLTGAEGHDILPDISPDGSQVVFGSWREGGGLFVVPTQSGPVRRLADSGYRARFSPDGAWVAYSAKNKDGSNEIFVSRPDGSDRRQIPTDLPDARCVCWTPDGKHLMFTAADKHTGQFDWRVTPIAASPGGPEAAVKTGLSEQLRRQGLPNGWSSGCPADWIGNRVLFVSETAKIRTVWEVPISLATWQVAGPVRQVIAGTGGAPRVAPVAGKLPLLVLSARAEQSHLWALELDASRGRVAGAMTQVTSDASLQDSMRTRFDLSTDGRLLVFQSERYGGQDIWMKRFDEGKETVLGATPKKDQRPLINSDGTQVMFVEQKKEKYVVSIADTATRKSREICSDCGDLEDWSQAGKHLLYRVNNALWALEIATGRRTLLLNRPGLVPGTASFSPDNRWIVLTVDEGGKGKLEGFVIPLTIQPAPENDWVRITAELYHLSLHWSPEGNLLYYFSAIDNYRCLWAHRLHAQTKQPLGRPFPVQHFHKYQHYPWNGSWISVGRDKIILNLRDTTSNIWMTELPQTP